jgi:hypothetical protein
MLSGWFDAEVQAKTVQDEIRRQVERNRLIAEAETAGRKPHVEASSVVVRFVTAARAILVARRPDQTHDRGFPVGDPRTVRPVANQATLASRTRPSRSAEPNAGMAVIARGGTLKPLQEPSGVTEC